MERPSQSVLVMMPSSSHLSLASTVDSPSAAHAGAPTPSVQSLVERVRRMALALARRLPRDVDADDLIGAGLLGLATAERRRQEIDGDAFTAFALAHARGAMLEELRRRDSITRATRARAREIRAKEDALRGALGREPTSEEVAAALGTGVESYLRLVASTSRVKLVAIDATCEGSGVVSPSRLPCDREVPADEQLDRARLGARAWSATDGLPERLARVVHLYYREGRTLADIAAVLGVTESRVCQLHGAAVRELRAALTAAPGSRARTTTARRPAGAPAKTRAAGRSHGQLAQEALVG